MAYLLFNPICWLVFIIIISILGLYLQSKRRQRDIAKGVEKALKKLNNEDDDEYWG